MNMAVRVESFDNHRMALVMTMVMPPVMMVALALFGRY